MLIIPRSEKLTVHKVIGIIGLSNAEAMHRQEKERIRNRANSGISIIK
jgi:hypothetical protein